jgi:hypothetical protein
MATRFGRISAAGLLILCLSPAPASGASERARAGHEGPVWQVDLRPLGFVEGTDRRTRFVSDARISFLGEDLLLASFWTATAPGGCTWKKNALPDRCRLHAVTFEVDTGRVRSSREWLFPFRDVGIYPARQGKFILLAGNELRLYSPDFQELRKVALPSDGNGPTFVLVYVSPSGRTLLADWTSKKTLLQPVGAMPVGKSRQKETYQDVKALFETDDLKELQRWESEKLMVESVSDNLIAASSGSVLMPFPFVKTQFLIRRLDQREWNGLPYRRKVPVFARAKLLDDHLLVIQEMNRVVLLNTEGGRLFEDTDFRKNEYLMWDPVVSAEGLRFAVAVSVDSSRLPWATTVAVQTRVIVYDAAQRRRIFSLALGSAAKARKVWLLHDFSLSRDGSLLGHSADGLVEIYRLPPTNSPRYAP